MVVILFKVYLPLRSPGNQICVLLNAVSVIVTPLRTQDRAKMGEVTGISLNKGAPR